MIATKCPNIMLLTTTQVYALHRITTRAPNLLHSQKVTCEVVMFTFLSFMHVFWEH